MYRRPSRKTKKHEAEKPNLIPILDSVFIFIFFLLMSANFVKIFEIGSDVPIVSDAEPPKNKKDPLNLTMKIYPNSISLYTGLSERRVARVKKNAEGEYDLFALREKLIEIKEKNVDENTIIMMPLANISYEVLVKIMDTVRDLKVTDKEIWKSSPSGVDKKITVLFNNIIFGDLQS